MTKHTQDRLIFEPEGTGSILSELHTEGGRSFPVVGVTIPCTAGPKQEEAKANARRTAALFNACQGIPTKALEDNVVQEMLGVLEAYPGVNAEPDIFAAWIYKVDQVITKAKGKS